MPRGVTNASLNTATFSPENFFYGKPFKDVYTFYIGYKMPKIYTTVRLSKETMEQIRILRAWLELSTGKRYSIDETIKRMATEFNKAVTIPFPEQKKK